MSDNVFPKILIFFFRKTIYEFNTTFDEIYILWGYNKKCFFILDQTKSAIT